MSRTRRQAPPGSPSQNRRSLRRVVVRYADAVRRNINDAAILSDDKRHAQLAVTSHNTISGQ